MILLALTACNPPSTNSPGGRSPNYSPSPPTQTTTTPVGIGVPTRDGTLEFTVHGLRRSTTVPTPSETNPWRAKGEFVIVDLTVKNVGDQSQTYYTDSQTLVIDGKQHNADPLAAVYLDQESANPIQPGLAIDIETPFDVAVGSRPEAVILDGDPISTPGGVRVNLVGVPIAAS